MPTIPNTNDGTSRAPTLRRDINLNSLRGLPVTSSGPRGDDRALYEATKAAGFEGIQKGDPALCRELGLGYTWSVRLNAVGEALPVAQWACDSGYECSTVHLAWGIEPDDEVDRLVEDVLNASVRTGLPIYVETHRATITQDMWRTVRLVERFPELRFNGDFSHWYTGHEMTYGDFESKLAFIQPVLERVRFIHGRIGTPGCIQVDIGDGRDRPHVEHFRQFWTRAFAGFLATAQPGDTLCFTSELLGPELSYARTFPNASGEMVEEGDRWQQAILLTEIAAECFAAAQASRHKNAGA